METTREEKLGKKLDAMRREVLTAGYDSLIYRNPQQALPLLHQTELYQVFKKMPKAWLCHAHFEANYNIDYSLGIACASDDTFISPTPGPYGWKIAYRQAFEGCRAPEGWTSLKEAVAERPALLDELKRSLITTIDDVRPDIWNRFEEIFITLRNIHCYRPHMEAVFTKSFEEMAAEGIQGVDFRFVCQSVFDETGRIYSPEEALSLYFDIEKNIRKKYPWFTIRFVFCSHKGIDLDGAKEHLAFAKRLSDSFPGRISGFDMVSYEDCGRSVEYYGPILNGPVPIIMHAGESVDPDNRNIEYALNLGINRIGHGMNLYRYPEVMKTVKERGVMLEVCPLSNQLLGYSPDLQLHPAKNYIKEGLNVTINSDDCGLFNSNFFTDDLLLAYLCWDLSLSDIKRCLTNSLSVADPCQTVQFNKMWDEFINSIQ